MNWRFWGSAPAAAQQPAPPTGMWPSDLQPVNAGPVTLRWDSDPDPFDNQSIADLDFFDPEGCYLGSVPPSRTPWWFDGETLIVTERDEQGVEYVVRYRVGAPPS